jgi:hypothetical protein
MKELNGEPRTSANCAPAPPRKKKKKTVCDGRSGRPAPRRLRKRPQRRAAGRPRPAVAWLVGTPASRDPAYTMVRPTLIRRRYSRCDARPDLGTAAAGACPYLNPDATFLVPLSSSSQSVVSTSSTWRILILEVRLPSLLSPSTSSLILFFAMGGI